MEVQSLGGVVDEGPPSSCGRAEEREILETVWCLS
jgi:hypothetical protein